MPESSIFTEKTVPPDEEALSRALGEQFATWKKIKNYILKKKAIASEEWNFSKSGWSCRIKGKKSVIIYLIPCQDYFKASFVLGKKACETVAVSSISEGIKKIVDNAKLYAEGKGFRIDVKNAGVLADIKQLIDIKLH